MRRTESQSVLISPGRSKEKRAEKLVPSMFVAHDNASQTGVNRLLPGKRFGFLRCWISAAANGSFSVLQCHLDRTKPIGIPPRSRNSVCHCEGYVSAQKKPVREPISCFTQLFVSTRTSLRPRLLSDVKNSSFFLHHQISQVDCVNFL